MKEAVVVFIRAVQPATRRAYGSEKGRRDTTAKMQVTGSLVAYGETGVLDLKVRLKGCDPDMRPSGVCAWRRNSMKGSQRNSTGLEHTVFTLT